MPAAVTTVAPEGNGSDGCRPARLPRWTRQEILVLIEGKRAVESRGRGRSSASAEPKWAAVSGFCRRQGVIRGAVQCRKRWSNLAGDYRKIKEWEMGRSGRGEESFWAMRSDSKKERKLPGFFDRELYDLLDGVPPPEAEEAVFDSGRSAADDALFSDFEDEDEEEEMSQMGHPAPPVEALPISEKKLEFVQEEDSNPDTAKDKQQAEAAAATAAAENSSKDSLERECPKRRRTCEEEDEGSSSLQSQIIEMLERNNRMLATQFESQNVNTQLDREQRKDQVNGLLGVLNKLADALSRIADKL